MRTRQNLQIPMQNDQAEEKRRNGHGAGGEEEKFRHMTVRYQAVGAKAAKPPAFGISKRKNVYFLENDTFESRDRHRYGICDAREPTGKRDSSDFSWNSDVYDSDLQRISWKVGD